MRSEEIVLAVVNAFEDKFCNDGPLSDPCQKLLVFVSRYLRSNRSKMVSEKVRARAAALLKLPDIHERFIAAGHAAPLTSDGPVRVRLRYHASLLAIGNILFD